MRNTPARQGSTTRTVLIIFGICAGVVVLLILGCAGVAYYFWTRAVPAFQSVQVSAGSFVQNVRVGQLQKAYDETSANFRAQQTFAQFQALVNKYPALRNYTSLNQQRLEISSTNAGTQAIVSYTVVSPHDSLSFTLILVSQNNEWRVDRMTIP